MEEVEALIRKQWGLERKTQRGMDEDTEKELKKVKLDLDEALSRQ